MNQLVIISNGWGVQTWTLNAMAALIDCECATCQKWSLRNFPRVNASVHSDTTFERAETYAFAATWTPWLQERDIPVVTVSDTRATHILKKSSTSASHYTLMPVFTLEPGRLSDVEYRVDADGRELTEPDEDDFLGDTDAYEAAMAEYNRGIIATRQAVIPAKRGQLRRQCTSRWKIEPLHKWLRAEIAQRGIPQAPGAVVQYLGISMDEWQRAKDSMLPWIENRYPLLDLRMTRNDCLTWLAAHNLPTPGKSACVQCPFHSRAYWQQMKREGGRDWQEAVEYDTQLRASGRAWYVHSDRKPLEEAVLLPTESGQLWLFDEDNEPTCDSGHCFL